MAKYYLINGKEGRGETLNILVGDSLVSAFDDISDLDLKTMEIKPKDARGILGEYNKGIDLSGRFFDASYPHTETVKYEDKGEIKEEKSIKSIAYSTIFDYSDEKTKYYMDQLRYFAEQRSYKKKNKKSVSLDYDIKLEKYIEKIMYYILSNDHRYILNEGSQIAGDLKEVIKEKAKYHQKTPAEFIRFRREMFKRYLTNYTQLRYLTLEYIMHINRVRPETKRELRDLSRYQITGMDDRKPIKCVNNEEENKQLTLDMFGVNIK